MNYLLFPLGLILGYLMGFHLRELKDTLKAIKTQVMALKQAQDKKELAEKPMGFASTMSTAELEAMEETEKIEAFNRGKM